MIKNYFKIAMRNLQRNAVHSAVNIVGLSIGLACVLVIISYVRFELSYDRFHVDHEDIFRVTQNWEDDGQPVNMAKVHAPLAPIIDETMPTVASTVRIYPYPAFVSADRQTRHKEALFCFADSTFFDVFTFKGLKGKLRTALDAPFSIILTNEMAIKYFGTTEVVGRELFYQDERQEAAFNITAVIENIPQNSHMDFDFLASFSSLERLMPWYNSWYYPPVYLYIKTTPGQDPRHVSELLKTAVYPRLPRNVQEEDRVFLLQHLIDIHLHSELEEEWEANGSYTYVELFAIVAGFILLIACINFMNLATARSVHRAREVGMRKVLGAAKIQLILQFLGESLVTTTVAFAVAFGLAELAAMHFFNDIVGKELTIAFLIQTPYWIYLLLSIIIISVMSGLYPAFYLSGFRPAKALKGKGMSASGRDIRLRKGLVVFQFFHFLFFNYGNAHCSTTDCIFEE